MHKDVKRIYISILRSEPQTAFLAKWILDLYMEDLK